MWHPSSSYSPGAIRLTDEAMNQKQGSLDSCSDDDDDEVSSINTRDLSSLECPICCESFNLVENEPYVLLCGHTLCKNCILGLQWAFLRSPAAALQLPFLISCPWCNLFSPRLVYRGSLMFPRKNFFLLWMLETVNGDRMRSHPSSHVEHHTLTRSTTQVSETFTGLSDQSQPARTAEVRNRIPICRLDLTKTLAFFLQLTSKIPFILTFLLIILYAIPASAAALVLYILITVFFALPSFFMLYFSYPILDWLVREIMS